MRRLLGRRPRDPIHVAGACDRFWIGHCAAMFHSVLSNQSGVHVHWFPAEGVSPRQQQEMREMVEALDGALSVLHVPRAELGELTELAPAPAWYRTFLPEYLAEVDRVLYLDADVIAVGSIEGIWETELGDSRLAAPAAGEAFDPGIMLLDLAALRADGSMAQVRAAALAEGGSPRVAINATLADEWHEMEAGALVHFDAEADERPDSYWSHRDQTPWPAEPAAGLRPEIHANPGHPHDEFFEPWREHRRQLYVGASRPAPTRAVITITHDEAVFLPIWLGFYSRFFAPEDIYVLDNDTTDGSTDGGGFVRIPVSHDRIEMLWMLERVAELQRELLDRYDVVLVCDTDEIVTPDPSWGDLGEYLDRFDEEFVNPLGYELLHLRDREPPLDLSRPILDQRHHWFAHDAYDKPVLATEPIEWVPGFHTRVDGKRNYDPDLRLIHLRRMDYDIALARQQSRARRRWDERDLDEGWTAYNQSLDEAGFARWFHSDTGFAEEGIRMTVERIPERWRGLF